MIDYTYSQGESPAIFYVWHNLEKIARCTGVAGRSKITVHMICGITLSNTYDTVSEACEAAAKFYIDNFYLDFYEKVGK